MKKIVLFAAVVMTATLLGAVPAAAQVPGIGVRLVPKVGLYHPLGDLVEGFRAKDHLAFGAAAELDLPFLPIDVRVNVDYTPATDIEGDAGTRAGTVKITNVAGDLVLRPLPGIIPVQPFLFVGGGVKQYRFREFSTALFDATDDRTEPTLHAGAGVGVGLGVMGFVIEAGDYISRFENLGTSKLQHDLYGTIGIRIGLF